MQCGEYMVVEWEEGESVGIRDGTDGAACMVVGDVARGDVGDVCGVGVVYGDACEGRGGVVAG